MTEMPLMAQAKACLAAEEALRLVRERGCWLSTPGGRVRGYEADGVSVELHTRFAGTVRVTEAQRYQAALHGRGLAPEAATLVVSDGWASPALVAALDGHMRLAGVARFREGAWMHEVSAARAGIPVYVAREDADDLAAASETVRLVAERIWPAGARIVYLGLVMSTRALWSHSALLPQVLAATVPEGIEIDAGPEATLARVCVRRLKIAHASGFEAGLRRLLESWQVRRVGDGVEVSVDLDYGREWLDGEMRRSGLGDLSDLEVRVALAAPSWSDGE